MKKPDYIPGARADWHSMSSDAVLSRLKTDPHKGLSGNAAAERMLEYGENKLQQKKPKGLLRKFLEQFSDFMVIILLIAAGISFFTATMEGNGDYIDSIIILIIVVINAITGVVQENRAERAIDALKKLSAPQARVIRAGKETHIPAEEVVPGDILLLDTGDFVAADARLVESHSLKAEESALTGESVPVDKDENLVCSQKAPLGDRRNMVFSGSSITMGHGKAVVVETGMTTQVGNIAHMINEEDSPQTPLQRKLAQTGKILGIGAVCICAVIFLLGLIQNVPPLEMFMISISLAVAAIPEGLPAVVTIVLAIGVRRMAIGRAIIRRLPAVETLGSATVICSDKTGTLTQNKMTVTEIQSPDGKVGTLSAEGMKILSMAALCNNSTLSGGFDDFSAIGEPTETALVLAAAKAGKLKPALENAYPRVGEVPFDSNRKRMTTIHRLGGGRYRIITKGAPDVLLKLCDRVAQGEGAAPLTQSRKTALQRQNDAMAARALRVLGVAWRDVESLPRNPQELERDLTFAGLVGMIDPPRREVKSAVLQCRNAGIRPVMITGDHIITARAIAGELGILNSGDLSMTGEELDRLSDEQLSKNIYQYAVFARVSPEHKVRIVKAFQSRGAVVAMTGDGVNDAPSLKAADIGCAMGVSGTDVAKGAADMILTDDNFATIVEAVRQGRGIFQNIKKTIHFLLSSNIGEIITVLTAFLMRLPAPLLAIQLLWVNLVTDSLPALALGVEPMDKDIMKRRPESPRKSLFADGMAAAIAIEGCFIGAISLLAFTIGRVFFDGQGDPTVGRTMAFAVLSISQLVHAFNVRSERSLFKIGLLGNPKMLFSFVVCLILQISVISVPFLSAIFKTAALSSAQWLIVALLSLSPFVLVEFEKARDRMRRRKEEREHPPVRLRASKNNRNLLEK